MKTLLREINCLLVWVQICILAIFIIIFLCTYSYICLKRPIQYPFNHSLEGLPCTSHSSLSWKPCPCIICIRKQPYQTKRNKTKHTLSYFPSSSRHSLTFPFSCLGMVSFSGVGLFFFFLVHFRLFLMLLRKSCYEKTLQVNKVHRGKMWSGEINRDCIIVPTI